MGVEADAPLRRGSRVKRPAARYVPDAESADTRAAGRKRVHTDTQEETKRAKSSTDEEEEEEEDDDDEDDDSEYCICRRGNDGSPMICCNQCGEWFHFKCLGLSKRAAEQMQEYVCRACEDAQPKDTDYEEEEGGVSEEDESEEERLPPPRKTRTSKRTSAEDHPVRQHVLTTFTSILVPLFAAKKLEVEAAHTYAFDLEAELFHAYGQDMALRAYKERFRSLAFNLKDQRNLSLHERITSGQLRAQDIVHMSNEALANDSIRQATEKAKRQALEQAILHEHADGPARKITHKGEVDIEREQGDTRPAPEPMQEMMSETAPETAPEPAPLPGINEMPSSSSSSDGEKEEEAQHSPEPISFTDVWHTAPKTTQVDTEVDAVSDLDHTEAHPEMDTCVDSFLGDDAGPSSTTPPGTPPPDSFVVRATQKAAVSLQPVVWDGVVTMPEYTSAYVHVRQLTQPAFVPEAPIWQDFFPAQEHIIQGRLPSKTAIDYLGQVRLSPRNDIEVLVMDAGGAASSEASTLHSSPALDKLVHYFADKERFGVLTPAAGAQGSLVKDFYLAPLLSHMPVPDWLKDIHPDGLGEAWDAERPANILLVVLVLFKTGLEGRTAPPAAAPPVPPGPPPSLDAILNVKPDAIQNLLSTLNGGGASPHVAVPAPGPPPAMPPSLLPPGPSPMPPGPPAPPPGPPPPQPMRPWGGVVRNSVLPPPAYGPISPAYGGAGSGAPHPFPVGPGGWYGGHADRVKDKSRRRRNGGGRR